MILTFVLRLHVRLPVLFISCKMGVNFIKAILFRKKSKNTVQIKKWKSFGKILPNPCFNGVDRKLDCVPG